MIINSVATLEVKTRLEELDNLIDAQKFEINKNLLTLRYATTQATVNDCVEKHDIAVEKLCMLRIEQAQLRN